jgi:hypothetical protein
MHSYAIILHYKTLLYSIMKTKILTQETLSLVNLKHLYEKKKNTILRLKIIILNLYQHVFWGI